MARKVPTATTSRQLKQLLPQVFQQIQSRHEQRPDLVLAAWPSLIGERLSPMTHAVSFIEGVLTIKVKNSSLLSLLAQHERPRLLKELRKKFPKGQIRDIRFNIG